MDKEPASTSASGCGRILPRRPGRSRLACAAMAALLAIVGGTLISSPVASQDTAADDTEVRIVARKLDDGRIEFGLQQRQPDDTWGDRQLPPVRFFPTTAEVGRWLASSPLTPTACQARIVARKLDNGKVEFGLQQRQPDDTWGDRQLPPVRMFPTTAEVGRWLGSSPLTLTEFQPANRYSAVTAPSADPALYSAIWRGQADEVRRLIANGAEVNAKDSDGDPLLREAIWREHTEIVRILVDAGADVGALDSDDDPLLHEAIWREHTEIVRTLVCAGADVDALDSDDDPLLHEAIWREHTEIVRILVDAGANVHATTADGDSMLHEASWRGYTEIVRILEAAGAGGSTVGSG